MSQFPLDGNSRPVDPIVESLVTGYANAMGNFIAGRVLPAVPTLGQRTGTIMGADISNFFGNADADYKRAEGAAHHSDFGPKLTNQTFLTQEYAEKCGVDWVKLSRSQLPQSLQAMAIARVQNNLMIAREARLSSLLGTGGNWTNTASPGTKWDAAGGDPVGDISTAIETVGGYGVRPNTMVVSRQARITLQQSPAILEFSATTGDRNKMSESGLRAKLAALFEIDADRIYYAEGRSNSASPGQTVSLGDIHDDYLWVGYLSTVSVPFEGGVELQPTAAARFEEFDWQMLQWDDPDRKSLYTGISHSEQMKVVQAQLGYPLTNVTT